MRSREGHHSQAKAPNRTENVSKPLNTKFEGCVNTLGINVLLIPERMGRRRKGRRIVRTAQGSDGLNDQSSVSQSEFQYPVHNLLAHRAERGVFCARGLRSGEDANYHCQSQNSNNGVHANLSLMALYSETVQELKMTRKRMP